jgi:hypothetical protein
MRGFIVAVTAGAALLAATPAGAQSPSYGGGLLPSAVPPRGYTPTMGIVLQPRGGTIALRFDTTLLCGNVVYDAAGRATAPFDGRSFAAAAARQFSIGTHRGNRVIFRWTLSGQVDGTIASGRLRITGRRFVDGRRTSCRHKPVREFLARISGPAATGAPAPPPRAAFGGTSEIRVDNGLNGAVVLKASRDAKKIAALWTALATCRKGHRAQLVNITPATRIEPDGSFSRSERFRVSYADALVRYRVRFAGRISGEAASGTLRVRARRYSARLRPIAPVPPGAPIPGATPQPAPAGPGELRESVPGEWSLNMTSDPADFVGAGQTWSHGPPGDKLTVRAYRYGITFLIDTSDGGWWGGSIVAPSDREPLAPRTYTARRHSGDGFAGFDLTGMGRGCNTIEATFTIHEIAFDPGDILRTLRVDFEQHCEGAAAALRGTWNFKAA